MRADFAPGKRRSVFFSFKFLAVSLLGSLTMVLVSVYSPIDAQIATLGGCVSILCGLFVSYLEQEDERERRWGALLERLEVPVSLAPEHELFLQYENFSDALCELSRQRDPVLREFSLLKLASLSSEVRSLSRGQVIFSTTETWRTVYEKLLGSPGLERYLSSAWVKTKDYWQDRPGQRSMEANFDAIDQGVRIARVLILRGALWPVGERLPSAEILPWIEEQHRRGVVLSLVRECELESEPDLLLDFGIYGKRATGVQELDEHSRTLRFILSFDTQSLKLSRDRWERLTLYTEKYEDLLDIESGDNKINVDH